MVIQYVNTSCVVFCFKCCITVRRGHFLNFFLILVLTHLASISTSSDDYGKKNIVFILCESTNTVEDIHMEVYNTLLLNVTRTEHLIMFLLSVSVGRIQSVLTIPSCWAILSVRPAWHHCSWLHWISTSGHVECFEAVFCNYVLHYTAMVNCTITQPDMVRSVFGCIQIRFHALCTDHCVVLTLYSTLYRAQLSFPRSSALWLYHNLHLHLLLCLFLFV